MTCRAQQLNDAIGISVRLKSVLVVEQVLDRDDQAVDLERSSALLPFATVDNGSPATAAVRECLAVRAHRLVETVAESEIVFRDAAF